MPSLAASARARLYTRAQNEEDRARQSGVTDYCPIARAEVHMPANGVCIWCHTDHSLASRLTNRELAGMRMLAAGGTRKQIAFELEVSETSVANDWRNIRQKLNAKTTTQAVVMLVREQSA